MKYYPVALSGGLETATPPNRLDPSMSPDLENIVLEDGSVARRGGFAPMTRNHPRLNSVSNRSFAPGAQTPTGSAKSLHVPGALLAGDRDSFTEIGASLDRLTAELFFSPEELETETAAPSEDNGSPVSGAGDPIPVVIRPLLSKGPMKATAARSFDLALDHGGAPTAGGGGIHWQETNVYGRGSDQLEMTAPPSIAAPGVATITTRQPHGLTVGDTVRIIGTGAAPGGLDQVIDVTVVDSPTVFRVNSGAGSPAAGVVLKRPSSTGQGCPFAVFLRNDPVNGWRVSFAVHSVVAATATFELTELASPVRIETGGIYHCIASVNWSTGEIFLRVGVWRQTSRAFQYEGATGALPADSTPPLNPPGPVQVFDMPQAMVEDPVAASPVWDNAAFESRPPGLGLDAGQGGYFFAAKRFAGSIQDVVLWRTAIASDADTARDRVEQLDISLYDASDVMAYWSMTEEGAFLVSEMTKRANPLGFSPGFPVLDDKCGGVRSDTHASWWFNGRTSYAIARTDDNPNWRQPQMDGAVDEDSRAWMGQVLNNGTPVGFQIEFVVDSVAEPFEQVLVEHHGHMRCSILPNGKLGVYYRDAATNSGGVSPISYVGPIVGDTALMTGQHYSALFWFSGGDLFIFLNGSLDASGTVGSPGSNSWPASGVTVGMGARRFTSYTGDTSAPVMADDSTARSEQVNTDSRSGFLGRIERVALVAGDGVDRVMPLRDEDEGDWSIDSTQLWVAPADLTDDELAPITDGDTFQEIALGNGLEVASHAQLGVRMLYLNETQNLIGPPGVAPVLRRLEDGGGTKLEGARVRVFWKVAEWVLDRGLGDEGVVGGRYGRGVEVTHDYSQLQETHRFVAEQETDVVDRLGFIGPLAARCIESDSLLEAEGAFQSTAGPRRKSMAKSRPFNVLSPAEVGPRWSVGIVPGLTGDIRPSVLADFHDQVSGERFLITAAGRNVYWAKPIWRADSPFASQREFGGSNDDGSIWFGGQPGDHVIAPANDRPNMLMQPAAEPTDPSSIVTFDVWVKPFRLDGVRVIASQYSIQTGGLVHYMLCTVNGALVLLGSMDGGTRSWVMVEGSPQTAATDFSQSPLRAIFAPTLRANAWNHVMVSLGGISSILPGEVARAVAWVNGEKRILSFYDATAVGGGASHPIDGVPDGLANCQLYLGGVLQGLQDIALELVGERIELRVEPWNGLMTEFRQINIEDPNFPANGLAGGFLPQRRYGAPGPEVFYMLRLNELQGWVLPNLAPGRGGDNGISQIGEMIPIGTGFSESRHARYESAVFRDRLYLTNGLGRMIEISFDRFSAKSPFRCTEAGMIQPTVDSRRDDIEPVYGTPWSAYVPRFNYLTTGTYQVWVAFVDRDRRESEPTLIGSYEAETIQRDIIAWANSGLDTDVTLGGTGHGLELDTRCTIRFDGTGDPRFDGLAFAAIAVSNTIPRNRFRIVGFTPPSGSTGTVTVFYDGLRIKRVPRSTQPHAVARRFYVSGFGGGAPLAHDYLEDNQSDAVELLGPGYGEAMQAGRRLPPPRARLVAAGSGTLFVGNLPELAAGGAAFAWSDGVEPTYFPFQQLAIIDSEDGQPLTGIAAQLSRFALSTRNATWIFSASGTATPTAGNVALRPVSNSVGIGGGITMFDNVLFGSGDQGVHRFDGSNAVYASRSLEGDWDDLPLRDEDLLGHLGAYNRDDRQFLLSVRRDGQPANDRIYVLHTGIGDRQVWSRFLVPPHTAMTDVVDPLTHRRRVAIATTSGQILSYERDLFIDGHNDEAVIGSMPRAYLSGVEAGGPTFIQIAALGNFFDFIGDGLRGMSIVLIGSNATVIRTIERNNAFQVFWREPAPFTIGEVLAFIIGGYDCYWTSGWIGTGNPGEWLVANEIDIEFAPNEGELTVANATAIVPADTGTPSKPTRRLLDSGAQLEVRQVDMANGYMIAPAPVKEATRGRYFRILVGNSTLLASGIRTRFDVQGLGFRFKPEGTRGGRPV